MYDVKNSLNSPHGKDWDSSLDLLRIFAFLNVVVGHFFIWNDYYKIPLEGKSMFLVTWIQLFSRISVPLFLMLTGYLMNRKNLSVRYYRGVVKTIFVYILASLFCYYYKVLAFPQKPPHFLYELFGFSISEYAWYLELYLCLFLFIPFLNKLYHGLDTKKEKQALLVTMALLTWVPSFVNWRHQWLPAYWTILFPITYYFVGAYLSEYLPKVKVRYLLLTLAVYIGLACLLFWHDFSGKVIEMNAVTIRYQNGIVVAVPAILIFLIFKQIPTKNWNVRVKSGVKYIAGLCLGAYLVSYAFDSFGYGWVQEQAVGFEAQLAYMPQMVLFTICCSLFVSVFLTAFANILLLGFDMLISCFSHSK